MVMDWQDRGLAKLSPEDTGKVLAEVNPHFAPLPMGEKTTSVSRRDLPFYDNLALYAFTDFSTMPPVTKYALYRPGLVIAIDWTNDTIYEANESAPLKLDPANMADYARFFFSFVRGEQGRIRLIESLDDVPFMETPKPAEIKALATFIHPLRPEPYGGSGAFRLHAVFLFQSDLFSATIEIDPDGTIGMADEKLLIEGMPAQADILLR